MGEGGFGVVYLARQDRTVKRRVALKVIKPGMDSKQVIARFGVEEQALDQTKTKGERGHAMSTYAQALAEAVTYY